MQALALVLLGRASEAEQLATNCLEAAKHMTGPAAERNSFMASCYNCLGEALREMGRVTEAEAAAREGLAMREKVGASGGLRQWLWVCSSISACWLAGTRCLTVNRQWLICTGAAVCMAYHL